LKKLNAGPRGADHIRERLLGNRAICTSGVPGLPVLGLNNRMTSQTPFG